MKVLIVCRKGTGSRPYITEQVTSLMAKDIDIQYSYIKGSGPTAYISSFKNLTDNIKAFSPDIIHAHYGLSGLFANLQRIVPVITTFHGSDINLRRIRPFSKIAKKLSRYSIFVSQQLAQKAHAIKNYSIQPCGIDFDTFYPLDKHQARRQLNWEKEGVYILFAGRFNYWIKNSSLAKTAIDLIETNIRLIELNAYTREEVNLLLNACDVALMTSLIEGSPQFIKEAMACNCPIVTTDVGSVKEIIDGAKGCFISSFKPENVREKLNLALNFGKRTNGRDKVKHLDNMAVAENIISIYYSILD